MTTFTIKTDEMRNYVVEHIKTRDLPLTVHVEKGDKRSTKQERTHRMWMRELEEQSDGNMTAEDFRVFCKLHFGVRLMKYQDERWAEQYDRLVKPLDYETKKKVMAEPHSYPTTSCMTTKNFAKYLDDVYHYFTGKPLDETKTMDEMEMIHFNMIHKKRTTEDVKVFVLTIPKKDDDETA